MDYVIQSCTHLINKDLRNMTNNFRTFDIQMNTLDSELRNVNRMYGESVGIKGVLTSIIVKSFNLLKTVGSAMLKYLVRIYSNACTLMRKIKEMFRHKKDTSFLLKNKYNIVGDFCLGKKDKIIDTTGIKIPIKYTASFNSINGLSDIEKNDFRSIGVLHDEKWSSTKDRWAKYENVEKIIKKIKNNPSYLIDRKSDPKLNRYFTLDLVKMDEDVTVLHFKNFDISEFENKIDKIISLVNSSALFYTEIINSYKESINTGTVNVKEIAKNISKIKYNSNIEVNKQTSDYLYRMRELFKSMDADIVSNALTGDYSMQKLVDSIVNKKSYKLLDDPTPFGIEIVKCKMNESFTYIPAQKGKISLDGFIKSLERGSKGFEKQRKSVSKMEIETKNIQYADKTTISDINNISSSVKTIFYEGIEIIGELIGLALLVDAQYKLPDVFMNGAVDMLEKYKKDYKEDYIVNNRR